MSEDEFREDSLPIIKSEHNLPIILMRMFIVSMVLNFILILALIFRPSKIEKVPYIVEFKTSHENYVIVKKANTDILSKRALVHRELKGYVEARETINKIDEARKWANIIRLKSNTAVYQLFLDTFDAKRVLWDIEGFSRECKVSNISDIVFKPSQNKFISIIEFSITDRYSNDTKKQLFYKVTIEYEFIDKEINLEDETLNPLGTNIIGYSITTINKKGINK